MPASARRSLNRSKLAGSWFVGRQVRGLCVKTWTDSPPISSIRSIAVWMPPDEETCAPSCTRRTLAEPGLQAGGLVLELAPLSAWKRREKRRRQAAVLEAPGPGDESVDEEGLFDVGVRADDGVAVLL